MQQQERADQLIGKTTQSEGNLADVAATSLALVAFTYNVPQSNDLLQLKERMYFLCDGGRKVTMQQEWKADGRGGSALGFGASVYNASFVLADYITSDRCALPIKGKRVLEIGTGLGLAAVGAALAGAREVIATDGDAELLDLTRHNVQTNLDQELVARVTTDRLLWEDAEDLRRISARPFDLVIAADVVAAPYEGALESLANVIEVLCVHPVPFLLAYRRRHVSELKFFHKMKNLGFRCKELPRDSLHPDFQDDPGTILMTIEKV